MLYKLYVTNAEAASDNPNVSGARATPTAPIAIAALVPLPPPLWASGVASVTGGVDEADIAS